MMMKRYVYLATILAIGLCGAAGCESQQGDGGEAESASEAEQSVEAEQSDEEASQEDEPAHRGIAQADIPEDQTLEGFTEQDSFYVEITPDPNPIPFQELFELEIAVYEDDSKESLLEDVEIDQVRAVMPAHNHGMQNEPQIQKSDDGTFRAEGMRFHMQGEEEHGWWVVEAVVNQNGTIDQTKFDVQCCRE